MARGVAEEYYSECRLATEQQFRTVNKNKYGGKRRSLNIEYRLSLKVKILRRKRDIGFITETAEGVGKWGY